MYIALSLPREILYERINKRVEQMIADGLEQEVRNALNSGVAQDA
ncbi:MAG: tRNA (adenosine(37)-N6)-dimethylallyltransferase MiaA, partial [Peptococcaceae bacterium]|nr:tRNA (adenosine(37)-N6)-dimethylallyltransferase MiaA [Peptococcaceae bacterium]